MGALFLYFYISVPLKSGPFSEFNYSICQYVLWQPASPFTTFVLQILLGSHNKEQFVLMYFKKFLECIVSSVLLLLPSSYGTLPTRRLTNTTVLSLSRMHIHCLCHYHITQTRILWPLSMVMRVRLKICFVLKRDKCI